MKKAIHRLKEYMDNEGISNSAFEKKNELSNGYIGTQLKRNADMGESVLVKVLKNYPDINPIWLIIGEGQMYIETENNKSKDQIIDNRVYEMLIDNIRVLSKENGALEERNKALEAQIQELMSQENFITKKETTNTFIQKVRNH